MTKLTTKVATLIGVVGITGLLMSTSTMAADGEAVYKKTCKMCHASGMMGAPKTGDSAAWADRIAKGIDTLKTNAVNGINAMPPKGGKKSLSDEEVHAAVAFMVESSQ